MSDDAVNELDRLLRVALDGNLDAAGATQLRDEVAQLRARLRGEGSLQTRYRRTVAQLRDAREALETLRDLADRWESVGPDVLTHLPTMVHALHTLADRGTPPVTDEHPSAEGCPFCDIVAGRGPAEVMREWPDSLVIKPLRPVTEGHVLVLPRAHVTDLSDDPVITGVTMRHAAAYAAELPGALNLITSRGGAASQSVFHLHVHLVPRAWNDGLALPWHSGRVPTWMARALVSRDKHALGTPMTLQEVATALNCSFAFVERLVERGDLRTHRIDSHGDVFFDTEVLTYRERDDARRRQAADELTQLGEELP